jgi:hypothetical protein
MSGVTGVFSLTTKPLVTGRTCSRLLAQFQRSADAKYNNAKQMDEAQVGTHPLPEADLMVEDGALSKADAVAAVVEEAELLHASVKIGSVAQIV